jgi:hypothetical protein
MREHLSQKWKKRKELLFFCVLLIDGENGEGLQSCKLSGVA